MGPFMLKKRLNRDKVRRFLSRKHELKFKVLKSILYFNLNQLKLIGYIYNVLASYNTDSFFSRVNNICIVTGRQSGVYKHFKLSRIQLRDSKYKLFGLRKSSW
jgi:ribosomal protein S14